jgi:hypothetical protein
MCPPGWQYLTLGTRRLRPPRSGIAAAAAQLWMMSVHPFCDDDWIEVGATSRIGEGAIRWGISSVLMYQ